MSINLVDFAAPQEINDLIWGEQYQKWEEDNGRNNAPCVICGRKCSTKGNSRHVLLDIFGTVYEPTDEVEDELERIGRNQGCFPVGSTCAKRIPTKYLTGFLSVQGND
jgi:hypothetical protein